MPAADSVITACEPVARAPRGPRLAGRAAAGAAALTLLAACGGGSSSASPPGGQVTKTVTSSASASATASPPASPAASPGIVAVTTAGALEVLNPATGSPVRTLVPSGVLGDEVSVASNGTVYFAVSHGCSARIESVADTGGSPAVIATGELPAVSPDGSKLAYTRQPSLVQGCVPAAPDLTPLYKLVVRTITTGAQTSYPMVPAGQDNGLPAPISHLSWAPDNQHLAVSVSAIEDNEGWNLILVDTAEAQDYFRGTGTSYVLPTGQPDKRDSYLREGVYLPDGNLFVSRACCAGDPPRNTSRLMWEVTPSGALVHQVAVGYASLDHVSLDASVNGAWLLYLAGSALYISRAGATPRQLASRLIAAAWE